jgi:hypothetical protein
MIRNQRHSHRLADIDRNHQATAQIPTPDPGHELRLQPTTDMRHETRLPL